MFGSDPLSVKLFHTERTSSGRSLFHPANDTRLPGLGAETRQ